MSIGFNSNYYDSGYTVSNGYHENNGIAGSVISKDIYRTTQQVGVYMINGGVNNWTNTKTFPIYCSLRDMILAGVPNSQDDGWIVYPGFGFQLFNQTNYVGSKSRIYINTSNDPVLFSFSDNDCGFQNRGTNILDDNGNPIISNQTRSVFIHFRGQSIQINNLT
jgi:calcineurin-like phosphoesterase